MHPNFETNAETQLQYQTLQLGGRLGPVTEKQIQFASSVARLIFKHLTQLKTPEEALVSHFGPQVQYPFIYLFLCDVQTFQSVNFG